MSGLNVDYVNKIKECEDILATIPASTMKIKASSVQHLLVNNAEIIDDIRDTQSSGDNEKIQNIPLLVNQLERNLLEVIRIYKDL